MWLRRIVIMAYWTGMRQKEIIQLEWNAVDLKTGFIRLKAAQTKTDEARSVRLSPQVIQMMKKPLAHRILEMSFYRSPKNQFVVGDPTKKSLE